MHSMYEGPSIIFYMLGVGWLDLGLAPRGRLYSAGIRPLHLHHMCPA